VAVVLVILFTGQSLAGVVMPCMMKVTDSAEHQHQNAMTEEHGQHHHEMMATITEPDLHSTAHSSAESDHNCCDDECYCAAGGQGSVVPISFVQLHSELSATIVVGFTASALKPIQDPHFRPPITA